MNLFGGAPPLPWFVTEVRVRLAASESDPSIDIAPTKQFILSQAAKFDLAPDALAADFASLGTPNAVAQRIVDEYATRRQELRDAAIAAARTSSGNPHPRVLEQGLSDDGTEWSLSLAAHTGQSSKAVVALDSAAQSALANVLEDALASLKEYD